MSNVAYYTKHFLLKTAFGHLILLFAFVTVFNVFLFSQFYWPKILTWIQNVTSSSVDTSSESFIEDEF